MARLFASASSQFLQNANAIVTGYPFTIACWGYLTDLATTRHLVSIGDTAGDTNYFSIEITATPRVVFRTRSSAGQNGLTVGATVFGAGEWFHACVVGTSGTDRAAYANGGNKATSAIDLTPTGLDSTAIGRLERLSPTQYHNGRVAEVAIWSVALNDAEVAALARGIAPPYIRPLSLAGYWPLWGLHSPELDLTANNRQMTVTGATLANHAPVTPFSSRLWGSIPFIGAAPGVGGTRLLLTGVGR